MISLNDGWSFAKPGKPVCRVNLPHTWNAVDGQDGGNDYWRGTAVYTKEFVRPKGERIFLEVKGAAMTAEVTLNGKKLRRHEGGYSTFRAELTQDLADHNVLEIAVDNSENDYVYPQKADFTFYGGLYRDVNLIVVPEEHFDLVKDGTPGIKVTPTVKDGRAEVKVETWQNADFVTITVEGQEKRVPSVDGHAAAAFVIENVHLWDGLKDPYLYTAEARLDSGDGVSARFGCRTIEFDPEKGFMLNSRVYPLRGVSRHQDRQGLGNALTMKEHKEDLDLIREIGANVVRLAHYQHAQEFYDLCDECGMIVWAEIPYITEHMPNGRQNTLDQMRELITQCYNHPCIVCWGLSNEIAVHGISQDLMDNHILLNGLCHKMDKTRPTTMAHAFMLEQDSPLISVPDLGGYNLYFGWYLGTLEQNDSFLEEFHEKHPDKVMGFTEYGADANIQFHSDRPESGDYTEEYQCRYHEYLLDCINRHPWLWITTAWNMFDFAADGRDEGGAHGLNQKGLVSFDRKVKKDAFYLYKAAWNHTDPFVHICGSRYVDRCGDTTEIVVYSNQSSVTLLVDGKEIGTQTGSVKFTFTIPLTDEHTVCAAAGTCQDAITIRKTAEPNLSYIFGGRKKVANWFDEEDFDSSCWSIRDSLGALMANEQTKPIVGALMARIVASRGDVAKSANKNPNLQKMIAGMSLQALFRKAGDAVPQEMTKALNDQLQKIRK